jgi:hypothetical protein
MPEGFGWWVAWLFISVTVFWAAVWYWLPALFRDRDREPPPSSPQRPRAPEPPRHSDPNSSPRG